MYIATENAIPYHNVEQRWLCGAKSWLLNPRRTYLNGDQKKMKCKQKRPKEPDNQDMFWEVTDFKLENAEIGQG